MSVPVIAFFNNKGGVGKTSLVYHVSSMLADQEYRVVAADLDPQGNLSAAFLSEERLEELWPEGASMSTIYGAIEPIKRGVGGVGDEAGDLAAREVAGAFAQAVLVGPAVIERGG